MKREENDSSAADVEEEVDGVVGERGDIEPLVLKVELSEAGQDTDSPDGDEHDHRDDVGDALESWE